MAASEDEKTLALKQYTKKQLQDAQDKRDALEGDTFKDFAEGAYNLLAGTSEGTVRAIVGVPGLIGDGLELDGPKTGIFSMSSKKANTAGSSKAATIISSKPGAGPMRWGCPARSPKANPTAR